MKKDDRHSALVRSVLVGLAAGVTALPLSAADAQSLSEYKAELARESSAYQTVLGEGTVTAAAGSRAAGETVIASTGDNDDNGNKGKHIILDSSTQYKELRAEDDGWMTITAKNGAVIPAVTVSTGFKDDLANGGQVNIAVGDVDWTNPSSIKDNTDQVADMTNVTFKAEGGNIVFTNGTVKVKAENLFGGVMTGADTDGSIDIGSDEAKVKAVVKLEGNTKFNTGNWTNDNGETVSGGNYIRLTETGTLEANSAQIFDKGLGAEGETADPEAVRSDANYAIDFQAGKLLLDDDKYNDSYLEKANTLVKAADGGTTEVVVKDTASKVDMARDISAVPNDSYAAGVTTSKTDVTIGDNGDSTVNKLNATYLNMAPTTDGSRNKLIVTDGRTLALGSDAEGRELLTVDNAQPAKDVVVDVTNGGKLVLGRFDVANRFGGNTLIEGKGSQLNVENGHVTAAMVLAGMDSMVNIASGATLSAEDCILLSAATMQVNGTLKDTGINGLNADSDSVILIGNDGSAGKVFINGESGTYLVGTKVFLDPVWKDGATISDASQFASEDSSEVDYRLTVGRNSLASLGTADSTAAIAAFGETGLNWGEDAISAALYLAKPVTLGTNGGIKVDGTATNVATDSALKGGIAEFADNSLLMVDASTLSGSAALTGNTLQVADKAKLYLDNLSGTGSATYKIAEFADTSAAKGWYTDSSNILTGKLFGATLNADSTVTASRKKLQEALPGAVLPNIVNGMTFTDEEKAKVPASQYMAQITNGLLSDSQSTQFINVAAQPAETVGATATAVAHSLDFAEQAQGHLSLLNASEAKDNQAWVKYNHKNGSADGLEIGGMSAAYDTSFNGVTVGYDLPAAGSSFRHGFAFSYGKGSNSGSWENNDYNTKGISWYGSLKNGRNHMLFDLGYYHTQHEVKGLWQARPETDVFTMGVTHEYSLPQGKDGNSSIVPHIGLRYSHVGTPSYSGYYGGKETFRYKPSGKNLISMPFGVGFVSQSRTPDWTTSFYADASYVPVLGGRSADMHVQACGIDAEDVFAYDASYGSAFVGSLGVKQESNSFAWGLNYRYSANSNQHSNDIMANIAFKF